MRSNDWSVASQRPRSELPSSKSARSRHRQHVAASAACRSSDSVALKGNPRPHNSVPLLSMGAGDDLGTFHRFGLGLRQLDHDGDLVRRDGFSKSLGSGTHRYRWCECTRQMTHAALSVKSSRPPRPATVWRSRAGLIATASSAKSDYQNTKGRKGSGLRDTCGLNVDHGHICQACFYPAVSYAFTCRRRFGGCGPETPTTRSLGLLRG